MMWDASVYPPAREMGGHRFLHNCNMTESANSSPVKGKEMLLVSISEQHLGFGYGKHACPG